MNKSQAGSSHLVLILFLALITTLLVFGMLGFSYLQVKLSSRITNTHQAYYSAEAIMMDTIKLLRTNPDIFNSPDPTLTSLEHDKATIVRQVTKETDADGNQYYRIVVNATVQGVQRQLEGTFGAAAGQSVVTTTQPIDIMLVLDLSGSMKEEAIQNVRDSSLSLIDHIQDQSPQSQLGIVIFNSDSHLIHDLAPITNPTFADSLNSRYIKIDYATYPIRNQGGTNMSAGLNTATLHLQEHGRPDVPQVIVFFSDGQPNSYINNACLNGCGSNTFCLSYSSLNYAPDGQGTCCSHDAIHYANQAKAQDYTIFSISYSAYFDTYDQCYRDASNLILLRISSEPDTQPLPADGQQLTHFKETSDQNQLKDLFTQIGETITTPGYFSFSYHEVEPDLNPSP